MSQPDPNTAEPTDLADGVAPAAPYPGVSDPKRNILAVLGGARSDAIVGAPGDRQSFGALALILFFTGGIAAISMSFALGMVFHVDPWWMLPIGIFYGAGIFAIDRAFTLQLSSATTNRRAFVRVIVSRLALAGIISVIVSAPMTLQIFKPEIDAELQVMQAEERDAFADVLENDSLISTEDAVTAVRDESKAVLDASDAIDPASSPAYVTAHAAEETALADYLAKDAAWQAEGNGTGGTGVVGDGPATARAEEARDAAYTDYQSKKAAADRALADATEILTAQRSQQKAEAQNSYDDALVELGAIDDRRTRLQAANDAKVSISDGILKRLEALTRLSIASTEGFLAHVAVFLFFFVIEMMPILMKLGFVSKKGSIHDLHARERDAAERVRLREHYRTQQERAVAESEVRRRETLRDRDIALNANELATASGTWLNTQLDDRYRWAAEDVLLRWDERGPILFESPQPTRPSDPAPPRATPDDGPVSAPVTTVPHPVSSYEVPASQREMAFIGAVLGGRFRLVGLHPQRGMNGRVYEGVDLQHQDDLGMPTVAVKVISFSHDSEHVGSTSGNMAAWRDEIRALEQLTFADDTTHLVEILGHGIADHHDMEYWIASRLYAPGSVAAKLREQFDRPEGERPPLRLAIDWMIWTAEGLSVAHGVGLSHGDLKPSNLVFDGKRNLRVIDFGLARTAALISPAALSSGRPRGTPYFTAPEIELREDFDRDVRPKLGDMYSLGAVYYWMLTGVVPREGDRSSVNPVRVAEAIRDGKVALWPLSNQLPERLRELIDDLLEADPELRLGHEDDSVAAARVVDRLKSIRDGLTRADRELRIGANLLRPPIVVREAAALPDGKGHPLLSNDTVHIVGATPLLHPSPTRNPGDGAPAVDMLSSVPEAAATPEAERQRSEAVDILAPTPLLHPSSTGDPDDGEPAVAEPTSVPEVHEKVDPAQAG